jgi:uncharacterized protein (DUF58 family)
MFVVISDFLTTPTEWAPALRALAHRHQVLAVEIIDPIDERLPAVGVLPVVVPEAGGLVELRTSSRSVRERYATVAAEHRAAVTDGLRAAGAGHLVLRTDTDWMDAFIAFAAASRRGRGVGRGAGRATSPARRPPAGRRP